MDITDFVKKKKNSDDRAVRFYGFKRYIPKSCFINHTKIEDVYKEESKKGS